MENRRMGPFLTGLFALGFAFMLSCSSRQEPTVYVTANVSAYAKEAMASVILVGSDGNNKPKCGAVSIYNGIGLAVLATAAHCVKHNVDPYDPAPNAEQEANIGDAVIYLTKKEPFSYGSINKAQIISIDEERDRAILLPVQEEAPPPLETAALCDDCSVTSVPIHTISPVYDWLQRDGEIIGRTYAGGSSWFYESTASIEFGWSGSAAINDSGKVVGIMVLCHGIDAISDDRVYKRCEPGWSIFTSIN